MKKNIIVSLLFFTFTLNCFAIENGELRANFKTVSFDFSQTTVKNSDEYIDSPYASLNSNDETIIKGTFDFALELNKLNYRWDNKIFATYGKTTVKDHEDGTKTTSENADLILLTSDYSRKMWRMRQADLGLFTSIQYQTEFTKNEDSPLNKIIRGMFGIKMFNGVRFSDLYFTNVVEDDLTYNDPITKYGLEIGTTVAYQWKEDVKVRFEGYFRKYFMYSRYNPNDLEYDLNFKTNLDVNITRILKLSPFISVRQAKSRGAKDYARNVNFGVSILYSDLFVL